MSKAKMQAARELIKEKRYSEARAILETVDHPVAVDWLIRLDEIAPVEKSKRSENTSQIKRLLMPRRGRSRLYWIGFTVFLCFGCYIFSVFGQIFGFIPTTEELNVTRTLEASTQVAQIATEDAVRVSTSVAQVATLTAEIVSQQMATDAQATNVALTPPTNTPLPTLTEPPSETPLPTATFSPTVDLAATQEAILLVTVDAGQTQVAINNAAILTQMAITDTPVPPIPASNVNISSDDPSVQIEQIFLSNSFVVSAGLVSVMPFQETLLLVIAQLRVTTGSVNEASALALRLQAEQEFGRETIYQFAVTLDDGVQRTDYTWNPSKQEWLITPLQQSAAIQPVFNETEYQRALLDGLFIAAGGRNIDSVRVADGRANGGDRAAIISYLTTETNEVGYMDEIIDIFEAVAGTIQAYDLDLDGVILVAATPTGIAAGAISVSVGDLLAYVEGRITRSEFISIFQTVTF